MQFCTIIHLCIYLLVMSYLEELMTYYKMCVGLSLTYQKGIIAVLDGCSEKKADLSLLMITADHY